MFSDFLRAQLLKVTLQPWQASEVLETRRKSTSVPHPNDVDWVEAPVVLVKVPRPFGVTACRRSGVHPMPEGVGP